VVGRVVMTDGHGRSPSRGRQGSLVDVVRKSLRLVVRMGLLFALVMILARVVQARRRDDDWGGTGATGWPPLQPDPVVPPPTPVDPPPVVPDPAPVVPDPVPPVPDPAPEWPPVQAEAPPPVAPARLVPERAAPVVKRARAPKAVAKKVAPAALPAAEEASDERSSRTAGRRRRPRSVEPWVEPVGPACPPSHPVKAKLTSRLFHLPGMAAYARTRPDRCYADAGSAETDGFTRAKR